MPTSRFSFRASRATIAGIRILQIRLSEKAGKDISQAKAIEWAILRAVEASLPAEDVERMERLAAERAHQAGDPKPGFVTINFTTVETPKHGPTLIPVTRVD